MGRMAMIGLGSRTMDAAQHGHDHMLLEHVEQDQDEHNGQDGDDRAGQPHHGCRLNQALGSGLVLHKAVPPGPGPTCLPQEVNTHHEHDSNSGDHAHQRGRHGVGPQIGGGDHIDQIGRAGKVCAGKGEATAGNRAGQQIAGQVGLLEQGEGNGIQAEHHHQSGDTAIDQHCAGENDAQDGKLLPQQLSQEFGNGGSRPCLLHDLSEQDAEKEEQEVVPHKLGGPCHIGIGHCGHHRLTG